MYQRFTTVFLARRWLMSIFIDIGAFYALAGEDAEYSAPAAAAYASNFRPALFVTSNGIFVECRLSNHHRLGEAAARNFWAG